MNCDNCKHFQKATDPNDITRVVGNCIVHPPQFILLPTSGGMAPAWAFPAVDGASYCGQYAPDDDIPYTQSRGKIGQVIIPN